jgi:hypothetical protein
VDTFALRIFQGEVGMQCRFILLAFDELNAVEGRERQHHLRYEREREAAKRERDAAENEMDASFRYSERLHPVRHGYPKDTIERSWMALQTIAVSAANLSKMFWGSRGRREAERKTLRDSLGVTDPSCLRDPDLRNAFEHFDERIECRIEKQGKTGFIGRNIGPEGERFIDVGGEEPETRFGHYDPTTGNLSFWDCSINVLDIVAEARRILKVTEVEALKPFWVEDSGEGPPAESSP